MKILPGHVQSIRDKLDNASDRAVRASAALSGNFSRRSVLALTEDTLAGAPVALIELDPVVRRLVIFPPLLIGRRASSHSLSASGQQCRRRSVAQTRDGAWHHQRTWSA